MNDMSNTENPKEFLGREKDCIQYVPMAQLLKLARVHRLGADKYGQKNWRVQPVRMSTYYNAMFRHMVEWFEHGVNVDPESKEHPLLHAVACALIILDGIDHQSIMDDRAFAEVKTGRLAPPPDETRAKAVDAIQKALVGYTDVTPLPKASAGFLEDMERRVRESSTAPTSNQE